MRQLVLGIAVAVTSLMPVVGMADDQEIADFIKFRLQAEQQQGNLQGFNVDMRVEEGTVWFKGQVSNADQEMTILKTAQAAAHLGVLQVVDDIEVSTARAPQVVAAPTKDYASQAIPTIVKQQPAKQVAYQQGRAFIPATSASFGSSTRSAAPTAPITTTYSSPAGNTPLPYASAPCTGPDWPSYAAHPNFGNVSYPQQYSPSAWPYIGPFYPYPQVPLGWRKVTLEWDDGFWMLDFHDKFFFENERLVKTDYKRA